MATTLLQKKFCRPDPLPLASIIRGKMVERRVKYEDIPGASSATFRRRINDPGTLTIEEAGKLFSTLKLNEEEETALLLKIYKAYKKGE